MRQAAVGRLGCCSAPSGPLRLEASCHERCACQWSVLERTRRWSVEAGSSVGVLLRVCRPWARARTSSVLGGVGRGPARPARTRGLRERLSGAPRRRCGEAPRSLWDYGRPSLPTGGRKNSRRSRCECGCAAASPTYLLPCETTVHRTAPSTPAPASTPFLRLARPEASPPPGSIYCGPAALYDRYPLSKLASCYTHPTITSRERLPQPRLTRKGPSRCPPRLRLRGASSPSLSPFPPAFPRPRIRRGITRYAPTTHHPPSVQDGLCPLSPQAPLALISSHTPPLATTRPAAVSLTRPSRPPGLRHTDSPPPATPPPPPPRRHAAPDRGPDAVGWDIDVRLRTARQPRRRRLRVPPRR